MDMDSSQFSSINAEFDLSAPLSSVSSDASSPDASTADRYILTQVGAQQLVFAADWVAEILLLERSQILMLPFYDPSLLGVVHHHGQVMPLVSMWQILENAAAPMRETLSVVQLGAAAGRLAGVGIVVDRASDNRSRHQFPATLFSPQTTAPSEHSVEQSFQLDESIQLFRPDLLPDHLWQPQRWQQLDPLG